MSLNLLYFAETIIAVNHLAMRLNVTYTVIDNTAWDAYVDDAYQSDSVGDHCLPSMIAKNVEMLE